MKTYPLPTWAGALLALAFISLVLPFSSPAAVNSVAWYRLGEDDPGASAGNVARGTTVDLVAGNSLRRIGSPTYTDHVATKAADGLGSSLAVQFNGLNQFYSNAVATTVRNNFGIEAWVLAAAQDAGTYYIAYNGNAASGGWGLVLDVAVVSFPIKSVSATFSGGLGGTNRVGAVSGRASSRWTHLALVRDNGLSTFYVNGVAVGSSSRAPATPAGAFAIAASPQTSAPGLFPGTIDEVRVFTFSPGQFTPGDLLFNQHRVTTDDATDFTPTNATLNGSSGLFGLTTTAWFEWGTTTALGNLTPLQLLESGVASTNFSDVLTGMSPNLDYFFRAAASNALGVTVGSTRALSTSPSAVTLPPTDLTPASATLNGVVNAKGVPASAWFEWGTTTNYGDATPPRALGIGGNNSDLIETLANLFPGGTFHYRAVLSNGFEVERGTNQSFVTPADPSRDLVIPGSVVVTIQPIEAQADGGRWTLDDGPAMFSGVPQAMVTPGHHTVQFHNLLNWHEPSPVDIYVVGGRTSQVAAVFTPIPTFDFHDVPEQHARLGEPVEFFVTGTPSPAQLQVTAAPGTAGPLTFDPARGRVTYVPDVADRLPFTLTFSLNLLPVATTTVTPLESLPPEEVVINYDRPLPDDESRDYITISETLGDAEELFNSVSNRLFTVDISGKTLVFDAAHPAHLLPQYTGRENIKEIRLFADRVIIRSPLELPQTHVSIHARELRFEGNGGLDTTPKARWLKPPAVDWTNDVFVGFSGRPGHNGGDVDLLVERFHADPTPAIRFTLKGGDGGAPGEGRDGVSEGVGFPDPATGGTTFFPFSLGDTNWDRLMIRAGNSTNCGIANNGLVLYTESFFNGVLSQDSICGAKTVARGEAAVPSGVPGAGGRGGRLRSTLDVSAYASQVGGAPGAPGSNYVGGTLFFQYIYRTIDTRIVKGQTMITTDITPAPKVPGANGPAPLGSNGAPGGFELVPDPSAWLHSFGLRSVVHFAKDAYLSGHDTEARTLLAEYGDLLHALQPVILNVTNLTDAEFAETTSLNQLALEMGAVVDRIDMNLDFFGNPAGWVPMLSFEANLTAFQNEINQSIPILYLAYWLNASATNLQNSAAASEFAVLKLREELVRITDAYNTVQSTIPGLKLQAANLNNRIVGLRFKLSLLEQQLTARAQQNVEDRHKLPFWKKALGVLSVAADLVPIGQPVVGEIGAGLGLLTKVDPNHPVQSALAITNAFEAFNNKDITLCFGGSNTNGPKSGGSTTNSPAKKQAANSKSECAKFLQSELKELVGVFKEVQVDSKELQAEIEKLKASDPVFLETSAELLALNKDKERFAADLTAALQALATLTSELTENTLATDEMENRVALQLTALDHNALVHIKEMERRAKDRLLQFQYFTAKAFQYRLLRRFNGNFQLNTLFDRFQTLVAGGTNHLLSEDEFTRLKNLFQEDLANTTDLALTELNANAPQHAQPRTFDLTAVELQTLNNTHQLAINLQQRGLFPSFHEDIRIVNLRAVDVQTHPVGGPIGFDAALFLDFNHLGESRLVSGGQTFLFRHYQTETVSPIAWNAVFDAVHSNLNNSVLSPSAQSLLRVLLHQPTDANMLLFSRPAANADILIRREAQTDNGIDLALDHLTLEVEYEFSQQSLSQRTLEVTVADDLQPVIALSQADVAGRRDGQGSFRRSFPANVQLTLEAPSSYGGLGFDRWVLNNQPRPAGATSVSFTLTVGTAAEARYSSAPANGVAPTIVQPPANVTAPLGATATFSVAATGTAPLDFHWQKNGQPLTDDRRISGATTATLTLSNVALADAASYSVIVHNPFGTRASSDVTLTVTAPALSPVPVTRGNVGFQFPTVPGFHYVIERKSALTDPVWTPVQTSDGTGDPMQFTRPTTDRSAFFRLRVE